jgi:hypothetical protein
MPHPADYDPAYPNKHIHLPKLHRSLWYRASMTFDGLKQNPAVPIFSGLTTVSLAGLPLRRRVAAIPIQSDTLFWDRRSSSGSTPGPLSVVGRL